MMFKRIVGMLIILMLVGAVMAQENITKTPPPPKKDCPTEETCKHWEEFKEKYGPNWTVKWHGDRGSPFEIFGLYATGKGKITSEEKADTLAISILDENRNLLKLNTADLKLGRVQRNKNLKQWTVIYNQYYKDVLVYRGEAGVTLTDNAKLDTIGNNFYPGINISTTPKITKEEAVKIVLKQKDAGTTVNETGEVINGTLLYIVPKTENGTLNYHLTWRVPTHTALYFINAEDGSIVLRVQTAFPTGEAEVLETTRSREGNGSVNYSTFALALLKKFWIPIALLILISFVVWRRKR